MEIQVSVSNVDVATKFVNSSLTDKIKLINQIGYLTIIKRDLFKEMAGKLDKYGRDYILAISDHLQNGDKK